MEEKNQEEVSKKFTEVSAPFLIDFLTYEAVEIFYRKITKYVYKSANLFHGIGYGVLIIIMGCISQVDWIRNIGIVVVGYGLSYIPSILKNADETQELKKQFVNLIMSGNKLKKKMEEKTSD